MSDVPNAEKLTAVYLKIKDKRAELSADFKEKDAELVEQLDKVKKALLDYCEEQGVNSVRTSAGLFYRSAKTRYWTSDWSSMHDFILENEVPELLDKRVNQSNMKQYLEENPDLVPKGLNVDSEYVVSVRRK
jgi:DNA-dependent RNA polymerase auxiliary subunit epsilon|tara:strand:- start:426 stop:821 length:396 start_codon:yes stop_codon:yes gene_type:complete